MADEGMDERTQSVGLGGAKPQAGDGDAVASGGSPVEVDWTDGAPSRDGGAPFFVYSERFPTGLEWLYPGMIPIGKVTLLIGDPGIGKSLLAVDLAARITRGDPLPPARKKAEPARVLFIAGDGETEDVLPERLAAFGADLTRVAGIEECGEGAEGQSGRGAEGEEDGSPLTPGPSPRKDGARGEEEEAGDQRSEAGSQRSEARRGQSKIENRKSKIPHGVQFFSLAHDLNLIHQTLARWPGCRLVVIDPISAFLDGVDANSNMDVRRLLTQLGAIARRYRTAVLVISHFRKAAASMLLYRSLGSIAFTLATRVVLTLAADPAVAGRRLLLPAKMNPLPQADQQGRAFAIGLNRLTWDPEPVLIAPDELRELTRLGMTVDHHVAEAAEWLRELLNGKPMWAAAVAEAARREQIPTRVLYAARKAAGVVIRRDGRQGKWVWESPFVPPAECERGYMEYMQSLIPGCPPFK